jgi:hypothetical protein
MRRLSNMLLAAAALALSTAAACGMVPHLLYGKRIAGQVVDAETGQPIAGAHVAFFWESGIVPSGFTGHNSRDICYQAAAAITDQQGRFDVAPWRKWSTYDVIVRDPIAIVYARRYAPIQVALQEGDFKPPEERLNERYALTPFVGTVDERLDAMWRGIANRGCSYGGCSYGGESQKSLFPMLKAMYEEARQISTTPAQRNRISSYAAMAADAAIAADPNGPSNDADVARFIEERLR